MKKIIYSSVLKNSVLWERAWSGHALCFLQVFVCLCLSICLSVCFDAQQQPAQFWKSFRVSKQRIVNIAYHEER